MTQINSARLAATMVLIRDDPFEVLMVRRNARAVFSSALVFPGGAVDEDDHSDEWMPLLASGTNLPPLERALRIAAIRETFEETALLLATTADGNPVGQQKQTDAPFLQVMRESGGLLHLDDTPHFGHWVTPVEAPRRFDTHFFVAQAPPDQQPIADGSETVDWEWASPATVVDRAKSGETSIIFPTLLNLMRLAESSTVPAALDAARARPRFTVIPAVEDRDGTIMVTIPAEAGYGVTEHIAPPPDRAQTSTSDGSATKEGTSNE